MKYYRVIKDVNIPSDALLKKGDVLSKKAGPANNFIFIKKGDAWISSKFLEDISKEEYMREIFRKES